MKRTFLAALLGVALALLFNATFLRASTLTFMNGLGYIFPTSHAAGLLQTNGFGTLTWDGIPGTPAVASNVVMWTLNGACPSGFTEYTTAQGRYIVGLVLSGTDEATVGTALTAAESRPVGQHTHTASVGINITFPNHNHTFSDPSHYHGSALDFGAEVYCDDDAGCLDGPFTMFTGTYASNTSSSGIGGVSITNASSGTSIAHGDVVVNSSGTTGTNAPYIQLMACKKS